MFFRYEKRIFLLHSRHFHAAPLKNSRCANYIFMLREFLSPLFLSIFFTKSTIFHPHILQIAGESEQKQTIRMVADCFNIVHYDSI